MNTYKIKQNKYLHFFLKVFRLLLIVFLLDIAIGSALKYFYFNQKSGRQYRANYTIKNTEADVLIFGSSRAYNHYRPDVFEERMQQSCYNSGSPGQFILYNYATLKAVLKRYSPKIIILEFSPGSLLTEKEGENTYDRLSFLLPYYEHHEEMRPVIDLKGPLEKYKVFSSIYPFNSAIVYTIAGYFNPAPFQKLNETDRGYQASYEVWKKPSQLIRADRNPPPIDSTKLALYKSFIDDCCAAGSKLYIVCSPRLNIFEEELSLTLSKEIAKERGIKFFDFTNDTFFVKHPELFAYDPKHLNHNGAGIFSNRVVDSIQFNSKLSGY